MAHDFQEHEDKVFSKHIADENLLNRENSEALKVNKYKELYKMEILKKEEEQHE